MVEQLRPTFAEQDRIRAAREDKAAECIERMERALLSEFDAAELYFVWTYGGVDLPIVREAIQRARAR
jgi:hypothetical protein